MKRLLIICALAGAGCLCHAQTLTVMAEQLAALETLRQTTTQGYNIMTSGVDSIGDITEGEFQLHQTYFGSLAAISPAISDDPKVTALRNLQALLVQQINTQLTYWKKQLP